jgi:hypothetical protein
MTLYSVALFVHVLGALGLFAGLALEWAALRRLRGATTASQVQARAAAFAVLPRLYIPSTLAILLPGLYMTVTVWGWATGWPAVALAAMVLLAALGAILSGSRMAALGRAAAAESGPISPDLRQRLRGRSLQASVQMRTALAVGIVFLMTVKPALVGSLLAIGVFALLGAASTLPLRDQDRRRDPAHDPAPTV